MSQPNYLKDWEKSFTEHQKFLLPFAFRMTGSLAEAEDLVQDTFLQCLEIDPKKISNPSGWLTKVCANKCIDHMKSAYKKRETYPGTWLPDAIPESYHFWKSLGGDEAPDGNIMWKETLSTGFLLMAEKLSPEERAIFLLSEVFDYPYKDIADMLQKSEEACRKTAERARAALQKSQIKYTSPEKNKSLIENFFESARRGDKNALLNILAKDSEFWSDGGGKVSAARGILRTPEQIANFFVAVLSPRNTEKFIFKTEFAMVNGMPGFVTSRQLPSGLWTFETIFSFEIEDGKILRFYGQRNPDKFAKLLKA